MRRTVAAPVLVAEGPILGWLDGTFVALSAQMSITADELAPGGPEHTCTPAALRAEAAVRAEDGESTDPLWAAIVTRTRAGPHAQTWRLIACGLALADLRRVDRRFAARDVAERCDIHADLLHGFLTGLGRIDLDRPYIARRLIEAGRRDLRRRRIARRRETPTTWLPAAAPQQNGPGTWHEPLTSLTASVTDAGLRLDPVGVDLIRRTIIDGQPLGEAAAALRLSTEAAYKRRRRAEEAIAAVHHITARRPAPGRPRPQASPDASAEE